MKAIEELMHEHRAIETMLRVLEAIARRADAGQALVQADLDAILEFLTVFADRCHHGKEEDLLFPAMEAAGMPREHGPIGVMLVEHDEGRGIIRALTGAVEDHRAGRAGAASAIASAARDYVGLLTLHIRKEDEILYPMAEGFLGPEDDAALVRGFEAVERDRVGPGKHEAFHALLGRLESAYLR